MIIFDNVEDALHAGEVEVKFTKVNGEERVMICTLEANYLENNVGPGSAQVRDRNPDVLVVYDTENAGWRSMRKESILEFKAL
jgi:hypothetical protein